MTVCARNSEHIYPPHNKQCPWCAIAGTPPAASSRPAAQVALPPPPTTPAVARRPAATGSSTPSSAYAARHGAPAGSRRPSVGTTPASSSGTAFSLLTVATLVVLVVTVLVPWQLGRAILRDRFFRQQAAEVYDTTFRNLGDYFLSDFIAGTAVLTILAGAVVAVRSIGSNSSWLIMGLTIGVVGGAVLIPMSSSKWNVAEARTTSRLAEGPPVGVAECGFQWPANPGWTTVDSATFTDSDSLRHVWRPIVIANGSDSHAEQCTSVEVFDGARRVAASDAIHDVESGSVALWRGDSPANSYLAFAVSANPRDETRGEIGVVRLSDGAVMWSKQVDLLGGVGVNYNGPALAVIAGTLVVEHVDDGGFGADETEIVGYDLETGKRGWKPSCPRGFSADGLYSSDDETIGAVLYCRSDDQTDTYNVDRVDGTLRPYDE